VFLEKLSGYRGIISKAYLQQVLEPIVFLLFGDLGLEYYFIEDGFKIHTEDACLPKLEYFVYKFNWPLSSFELNSIEDIWQYMKEELKKLFFSPITKGALKEEVQRIWDELDFAKFRYYIERITYIIEDIIKAKGGPTVN